MAQQYDLQHPGVVRLIKHVLKVSRTLEIPASVCGEVAGERRYTRLLLALGLKEFSMHPARLLEVKQVIRETHVSAAKIAINQWLDDPGGLDEPALLDILDQSQTDP